MSNTKPNKSQRSGRNDGNSGGNRSAGGNGGGGKNASGKNNSGGGNRQAEKGRSNNRRRKGPRKKKVDPRIFWGDPEQLTELGSGTASITAQPSAVVQSLGRPPLSGQQNAAEHYFVAVYDRAVNLAAALAAAGGLIEAEELNGEG